jgi:hypothetical protein
MEQLKNIINDTNKISSQTKVGTFQKYFALFIEGIFLVRMQYICLVILLEDNQANQHNLFQFICPESNF